MNVNIPMSLSDQDAICLDCPLPDCVGRACRDCPIQVEQRRRWRAINQKRAAAGYFTARDQKRKQKAEVIK